MANQARHLRIGLRLLTGLLLALAGMGLPSRQSPSVHAAPQAGGTFTVNSAADNNSHDSFVTLREALRVAIGNPGAPGGGATQPQSVVADATGHWSATLTGGHTRCDVTLQACTAPCAYSIVVMPSHSDTSELSPLFTLWLPLVRR